MRGDEELVMRNEEWVAARIKKEHHTEMVWCSRKDQIVRSS